MTLRTDARFAKSRRMPAWVSVRSSGTGRNWAGKGLLEATEAAGRYRKMIDLKEIGLETER